jgi:rhodanese-related sulfurtransferase
MLPVNQLLRALGSIAGVLGMALAVPLPVLAAHYPAASIPSADLIQPAALAASLQQASAPQPLILQVGSEVLFQQAHIPGSEYAGAGGQDSGLRRLEQRVSQLRKDAPILLYCGCCPWGHCPNVGAAYHRLRKLGFSAVKALYIADDFGTDWVEKGYPVGTGP